MSRSRRAWLVALGATAVVHAVHFERYFIRDEVVGLHRVSAWSVADIVGRATRLVHGSLGERPHVLGYLWVKALWSAFGPWYAGYAAVAIAVHLVAAALVGVLASRLAPSRELAGPAAALLFGVSGASADAGNFAIVQHALLAIATVWQCVAYLGFRESPRPGPAAAVLAAGALAALSLESGPVATLAPVVVEVALGLGTAPAAVASARARAGLCAAAFGVGLPRLVHDVWGLVVSSQVLDAAAPERYGVRLGPLHVLANVGFLLGETVGAPPVVGALLGIVLLSAARSAGLRPLALAGVGIGLLLAVPLSVSAFSAPFYAYAPSAGWALAGSAALLALAGDTSAASARVRRAVAVGVALGLTVVGATRIAGNDARDAPAFRALRALRRGLLDAVPAGGPPAEVVLHGVPTGDRHPDYPLMLGEALPLLVPGRTFSNVWVVAPSAREPLVVDGVTYVAELPGDVGRVGTPVRAFAVRGELLVPCTSVDCGDVIVR